MLFAGSRNDVTRSGGGAVVVADGVWPSKVCDPWPRSRNDCRKDGGGQTSVEVGISSVSSVMREGRTYGRRYEIRRVGYGGSGELTQLLACSGWQAGPRPVEGGGRGFATVEVTDCWNQSVYKSSL